MDNTETVPASDANRDELVERLKRENAALMEQKAASDARAGQFESKERARVTAWQSDVKSFLTDFVLAEAPDAEAKADCQPVVQWGDEYASKADIVSQTGLARVCAVASKGVKRLRDEASQLPELKESLANALKENETLKGQAEKMQRESHDDKTLLNERQAQLELLNKKIAELGGEQTKFDFSQAAAREVAPPPEEPAAAIKSEPALTAVSAQASKAAAVGNPFDSDPLLSFITKSGSGSLRMGSSSTNHALLGSSSGEPDIGAIIRSGKQPMF
ncbi:MAG: hypothetical protein CMM02_03850 [Rhodopirellula sp.]|mgnify:CR=1 FL=1|jgi:myosin heavy subunit|nr:hypothetical protein [Rhodopirellula sp.]